MFFQILFQFDSDSSMQSIFIKILSVHNIDFIDNDCNFELIFYKLIK